MTEERLCRAPRIFFKNWCILAKKPLTIISLIRRRKNCFSISNAPTQPAKTAWRCIKTIGAIWQRPSPVSAIPKAACSSGGWNAPVAPKSAMSLENAISGCTVPSHNRVRNHIVSVDENGDGYVATYIPKSEVAPLMTTIGNTFYIRSGSNNVPAPYSVLAGMFGRRPQAEIGLVITDKQLAVLENSEADILYPGSIDSPPEKYLKIGFSIRGHNQSNVIARELYLSCTVTSDGGEYNKVRFSNYNQMDSIPGLEGQLNLITRPELRVPPRSILRFTNVEIILSPYIEEDFLLDGVIGADGTAPRNFRIYLPKNRLRSFVAKTMREDADEQLLLNEFFSEFLSGETE